ncbi:hypothetical protein FIBSPDRAFT_566704 [Athelia psychrophila]|uniref:Uncharacterized protein n=1 Tax=Athelia psychrophila TaxID=1759441 RepID=A0A166HZD4_9AGAM|nr:hypothetical protein FIBSPDRAFT_566704 [Fibularhizoctonia sp. CBS 109695]
MVASSEKRNLDAIPASARSPARAHEYPVRSTVGRTHDGGRARGTHRDFERFALQFVLHRLGAEDADSLALLHTCIMAVLTGLKTAAAFLTLKRTTTTCAHYPLSPFSYYESSSDINIPELLFRSPT